MNAGFRFRFRDTDAIKLIYRAYEQIVKPRVEDLAIKVHPIQRNTRALKLARFEFLTEAGAQNHPLESNSDLCGKASD
jgi:hypothetical protein